MSQIYTAPLPMNRRSACPVIGKPAIRNAPGEIETAATCRSREKVTTIFRTKL
jgi:hypothetical protein